MGDSLTYNSLISDIEKNSIKNIYLLYGIESFLMNDIISRMEKKIVNPGLKEMNFIKLDGQSLNSETMINACETLPFMDERKLVIISDCMFFKARKGDKESEDEQKRMEEMCGYLQRLPETTVLIMTAGEQVDKRKKLYGTIKKYGEILELNKMKPQELVNWVLAEFKHQGKSISTNDAQYLVTRVPGNLNDIINEINKLSNYIAGRNEITARDIDAVVPVSLETNIFQLVDMISNRNPGAALTFLNGLLMESEPVIMILFMIARQYRLLLNTKLLMEKGYSGQEISGRLGVQSFVLTKLMQFSKQYTEKELKERLIRCLDTDASIKTGKIDPRIAVETLIVEFADSRCCCILRYRKPD